MKKDKLEDFKEAARAVAKGAVDLVTGIPGIGVAIDGYEAYRRSQHERNTHALIDLLRARIDGVGARFDPHWFKTMEGQEFCNKALASALDSQLAEKQEFFANAIVHAASDKDLGRIERLKFLDMLRGLSMPTLMVLSEIDQKYSRMLPVPGQPRDPSIPVAVINDMQVAQELSHKYDPFVVTAALNELRAQGLFSNVTEWHKMANGGLTAGIHVGRGDCYTPFSARFVAFISEANS